MKRSNSKSKAPSAFKKLGAVALITATIFFVACKQTGGGGNTGGGGGKPKPKHVITFSVDSTTPNGTLTAKVDGIDETDKSPITIEQDKTITFTATPIKDYRVKEWKVDSTVVTGNKTNIYTHTVTKATTVTVSFEKIPTYKVEFSVDGANGTLKAKAEGVDETSTSPITVEEGKTITFTATAHTGYRLKEWKLDGKTITEAGTKTEYTHKVSAPANITVSFEKIPTYRVYFEVEDGHGWIKAKADGREATDISPITVEEGKTVTFTAEPEGDYRVNEWKVYGVVKDNKTDTYTHTITQDVTVKVSFKRIVRYRVKFDVNGGKGYLRAKVDGKSINSWNEVEEGKTIIFTAEPDAGYKVKEWKVDDVLVEGNTSNTYTHILTKALEVKVSLELLPPGKVTLTLDDSKLNIEVQVVTADGSAIAVEGCTETSLASRRETTLHATGTTVTLKGKITELRCEYNKITDLNVQGCPSLKHLDCSDNQLTELNVQGLSTLKWLSCSSNKLTTLDVQGLTALEYLNCWRNQLTSLNVQGCISLDDLQCSNNKFTTLDLQGLTALQELECEENQLTSLNLQDFTALQELKCGQNQLTSLNLQGCTALQKLICYKNQLTTLDIHGFRSLKELNCHSNQLTEINMQDLHDLKELQCDNNQLTSINVQGLKFLKDLSCSSNKFTTLNVQSLPALQTLYCSGNQLKAQAMTEILKALPSRTAGDDARAYLYTEETGVTEGNCKDYTQPEDLKKAFDGAKKKNWTLKKTKADGWGEDL